jgi:hypothetical protein
VNLRHDLALAGLVGVADAGDSGAVGASISVRESPTRAVAAGSAASFWTAIFQ